MNMTQAPLTHGILPDFTIKAMFGKEIYSDRPLDADQIQPASIDVRLGKRAWRTRASFLPGNSKKVEDRLTAIALHELDLTNGAVLETGCVYLVELLEGLDLPEFISATANPKSSTGRLDVFTRVITDYATSFDKIIGGYSGKLYLEISPQTFPVLVRTGSRLSQLRFRVGNALLTPLELEQIQTSDRLVDDHVSDFTNGLTVSIDLSFEGIVGYRAKRHSGVIDVDKKAMHRVVDFWEAVETHGAREIILDPDEFYILVSKEAVHVPPNLAAEMLPFDALVGEFRAHYAGFFDPGFGHLATGGKGSRAVLEVRSREVPFILEHGQTVARLIYEKMQHAPNKLYGVDLKSNYQGQGLKLSKHFIALASKF
jgi:dCTP deaminase